MGYNKYVLILYWLNSNQFEDYLENVLMIKRTDCIVKEGYKNGSAKIFH